MIINSVKIILSAMLIAVVYGILHDQITARIYLEYFTVWHRHIIDSTDPTVVAFVWGIVATWWVGLGAGMVIAIASNIGGEPRFTVCDLIKPAIVLVIFISISAFIAGIIGYFASDFVAYLRWDRLSTGEDRRHIVVWFAHMASYNIGTLGVIFLFLYIIRKRIILARSMTPS